MLNFRRLLPPKIIICFANFSDRLILSALFPYLQTRIENSRANSLALNPCDRPSEKFKRTKQNDAHSENTKTGNMIPIGLRQFKSYFCSRLIFEVPDKFGLGSFVWQSSFSNYKAFDDVLFCF